MSPAYTLQALLDSQGHPFVVVDAAGRIRQINNSLRTFLKLQDSADTQRHCCGLDADPVTDCRHKRFFRDLEPYVGVYSFTDGKGGVHNARVQGFPLLDGDGTLYLGESIQPLAHAPGSSYMVGNSRAMQDLRSRLTQAASTDAAILLRGETGSGKELAARFIHDASARADAPFVVVDCTVLSEDLFESELFGHIKGSFTGATGNKTGLFELADGGTLFLDEIGELPISQQPKLLRALESGTFRRVGSTEVRHANVRVLSATHQNLQASIALGGFRRDLYYRLAVLPLAIPPLRERREDIPLLAEHILHKARESSGRSLQLEKETLIKLLGYSYPGNIRELHNLLQLGATLSPSGRIAAEHIPLPDPLDMGAQQPPAAAEAAPAATAPAAPSMPGLSPVEAAESHYIMDLLQRHSGSRKRVAANMNVSERTLYRKLKRYGLNRPHDPTGR